MNQSALEQYTLNRNFTRESDLERLQRLEMQAFGAVQQGDINTRYDNVRNATFFTKTISSLIEKLKGLSEDYYTTTKNAEKQVNQSINFSQKEHESISSNADKMLVLRQKIQMIAELILELSAIPIFILF